MNTFDVLRLHFLSAVLLSTLAGCSGSPAGASPPDPAPTGVVVALDPKAAEVRPGGSVAFTASVTGTLDVGVSWSVQEGASGGSVSADGVYVAPTAPGTYHVVAASRAEPVKLQVATVSVAATPVSVNLLPSSATLDACGSVAFAAAVTGTSSPEVVWSVKEGQAGGTVTSTGIYTAPTTAGTFHVMASSVADPSQAAEAAVVVGPEKVISVAVTPGSASVTPAGALAFSAVVTTSCGTFAAQ